MRPPLWLSRREADVGAGEAWLGAREREALAGLTIAGRRTSWRLGRWTAKQALIAWLGAGSADAAAEVEVLAAPDGAPEAWAGGARLPVAISITHRAGRALALVADAPARVGCDLEVVEVRSDAFVRQWLAPEEQEFVRAQSAARRDLAANLVWTAKEAAAKVRREGLRLDVRDAVTVVSSLDADDWRPLDVVWRDGHPPAHGWWRAEPKWVMTVLTDPAADAPRLPGW